VRSHLWLDLAMDSIRPQSSHQHLPCQQLQTTSKQVLSTGVHTIEYSTVNGTAHITTSERSYYCEMNGAPINVPKDIDTNHGAPLTMIFKLGYSHCHPPSIVLLLFHTYSVHIIAPVINLKPNVNLAVPWISRNGIIMVLTMMIITQMVTLLCLNLILVDMLVYTRVHYLVWIPIKW
jgi:hypothetical protein